MTDRPIIFSGPMIRALLASRKAQTRRMLADGCVCEDIASEALEDFEVQGYLGFSRGEALCAAKARFDVGDRLWVRETWSHTGDDVFEIRQARIAPTGRVIYAATPAPDAPHAKYWPSIHMPREFSRLTLAVTEVRVQRLADLSEEDAIAEGVCVFTEELDRGAPWGDMALADRALMVRDTYGSAVAGYRHLWETINGTGSWDRNPWVVALTFEVHQANIAALVKVTA